MTARKTPQYGPAQTAVRAMVAEMGKLSPRQQVTAESAFAVAALLDVEGDGTKAAALSRELRIAVASLAPLGQPLPVAPPSGEKPHADAVTAVVDKMAQKRAERARRSG